MNEKPQLIYFDIRGRAEVIRLLLEDVGAEYEDVRVSQDDWAQIRSSMPFRRVPVYRERNLEIPETYAILGFLGRRHGLLGSTEPNRIRCDVAVEAFRDYGNRVATVFGALSGGGDDARRRFVAEELPERLRGLESFYGSRPAETVYWAGESTTVADYAAFHLLEGIADQFPEALSNHPELRTFQDRFSARPRIADYLSSSRRPAALFFGPSGKIYPRSPRR